jgi:type VII secretion-associated serine protease mycosin
MLRTTIAAAAAVGQLAVLTLGPAAAAHAAPVDPDEWWFPAWAVQSEVWPLSQGTGVTVAVIDSGVNASIPDLRDAVLPGTDMRTSGLQVSTGGDGRQDHDVNEGHGTAMASLIASRGTHSGFYGIAPKAKILPIYSNVTEQVISPAIRYAVDHGAKVISISMGTDSNYYPYHCPPQLLEALKYADAKDVLVVAAAGNEGDFANGPEYPGSCPGVLAVGAIGPQSQPWEHTQRQDYVTVAAPGADVGGIGKNGHVYSSGEGTSQATALTSGAAALLRSRFPNMKARRVVQILTNTAKDFGKPGKDDQLGYGVISIPRALRRTVPDNAPNPVYERLDHATVKPSAKPSATPAAIHHTGHSNTMMLVIGVVVAAALAAGAAALVIGARTKGRHAAIVRPAPHQQPGPLPPAPPATYPGAPSQPNGMHGPSAGLPTWPRPGEPPRGW